MNEVGAYGRGICFKEVRCVVRKRSGEKMVLDTEVLRWYGGGGSDMSVMWNRSWCGSEMKKMRVNLGLFHGWVILISHN